jgi:uncharacterized protein involved in outer membrane biogenesis
MRKIVIAIFVVVLVVILAAVVVPFFVDANAYRGKIEAELTSKLGRDVKLGNLHLRLVPFNFKADSITIAEDPRFQTGHPFAQSGLISVSPKLGPLLHKDVQITSVELVRPQVQLVRDAKGTWNFSTLGKTGAAPQQPSNAGNNHAQNFQLDSLVITDGQVTMHDLKDKRSPAVYDHIDFDLKNFAPDKQFPVHLAAHLPGSGSELLDLNGNVGPIPQDAAQTPVDATLTLRQVSMAGFRKFMSSNAMAGMDAMLDGTLHVQQKNGDLTSNGNLTANDVKVSGAAIGQPISADYKVSGNLNSDVLHVSDTTVKVGSTPIHLNGTVDTKRTPAALNLTVKANNAPLSDIAHLAAAAGAPLPPGSNMQGNVDVDVTATGAATAPELAGQITANNAGINGIPHPVSVKQLAIKLTPHAGEPAARVATENPMAKMLNGNLTLNLDNGQIGNLNFLSEAANAGKFLLGNTNPQKLTQLVKVTGNFNLVNGIATTNDLKAVLAEGPSAAGVGTIDLIRQVLNLRVTAVLPPSVAKAAGGAGGVGGLMQTVLANPKGELVVPLIVSGTFQNPQFAPDLQQMAQMRLKNLTPSLDNPGALSQILGGAAGAKSGNGGGALGEVMGALGGQQKSQSQPGQDQQQPPQPGVGGVLQGILGGGKKKPPQ